MSTELHIRPILWVASSKKHLMDVPLDVRRNFGHGLHEAQIGRHPKIGKTLKGFGNANVVELVDDHESGTYRAVYTVRFAEIIVVLHVFQKKSKKGIETDKKDIDLIKSRLNIAKELYEEWKKEQKK